MAERRAWTIAWNEKAGQFIARFRNWDGTGWGTKRIPRSIPRHAQLEAERFMIGWYQQHVATGGVNALRSNVTPIKKTLRLIGPRWLQHRFDDRGTKRNTYNGLKQSLHNWILDNDRFEHASIDSLDMESDFVPEVCLRWVASLKGADSSVVGHASDLRALFEDAMGLGWLSVTANPMDHPLVKKRLAQLRESAKQGRIITVLDSAQVEALLTTPTRAILDYRRLRYLIALATGLRDHELQGLAWDDLHLDAEVPHLVVDRQLDKIGPLPFAHYRDLQRQGLTKTEIATYPTAVVSDPKKNSRRAIPLLPLVVNALRVWSDRGWLLYVGTAPKDDDPIFPSGKRNTHNPPGQFCFVESATLLREDLERVGQPTTCQGVQLDFHALRRTFATMLSTNGVSDGDVGDLLGHGAKNVARGHYIARELLARRLANLERLPLPGKVRMQATVVVAAALKAATVVEMPIASGAARPRAKRY